MEEQMKNGVMFFLAGVMALTFSMALSLSANAEEAVKADKVTGVVVTSDGDFVSIKTEKGEVKKFHMDKTTTITGDLTKVGAKAEITEHDGHAISVVIAVEGKKAEVEKKAAD